jgi:DNA (cytosine-5)-methyltransferase 1
MNTYRPTAKSYFSGIGGMDLGLQEAGIDVVQSLELDAGCVNTMRKNFNHPIAHTDIKDITVNEQPQTDIIVGTYPCNKYSTIADIHKVRTGDDLFLHFFRHIALERPSMYIVENVPGMKKFPVVMEAMSRLPDYWVNIFCPLNATNWLPQNRKRLILIGTRKRFHIEAPKSGITRLRLRDLLDVNPEYHLPKYLIRRMKGKYRDRPIIVDPTDPSAIAPTCVAHYAKDLSTRLIKDPRSPIGVRPFTIREYARLQGFPDDFWLSNTLESYRQIGNAVPVDMARWIGSQAIRYFN